LSLLLLWSVVAQAPIDEGTLVVRADTHEVARETFRFTERGLGASAGWTLTASIRWSDSTRSLVIAPLIQLSADTEPARLQFEVSGGPTPLRILGQPGRGRFTIRFLSPKVERARELAVEPPMVILDDSVFAPFLIAARRVRGDAVPRVVSGLFVRAARRERLDITDRGPEPTSLNHDSVTLRHVVVSGPVSGVVHLWLATDGRLMKVEIPSRGLIAERLPSS
jgi:hypothetical protein